MSFWKFINKAATENDPASVELRIEGDIVSDDDAWLYEWFGMSSTNPSAFKSELASHKGMPITVWIDSNGGDVFAAASIYNALKEHDGKVTVKVDGKAISAASVIAMAGSEILMSPVAVMMIHNPLTYAVGNMHELRHVADILDTVKDTIINAYQLKTKKSRNKISEMMDDETWMSAKAAMKEGFADNMLYAESNEQISDYAPSMAFSRLAIQNSAKISIDRLRAFNSSHAAPGTTDTETLKAMLELELED